MSIVKERTELLNELLRKFSCPLSPDAGHATLQRAAADRLVKNGIMFHNFLDTYPDVVEAEWSEIVERLEIHAQFDKAGVLTSLIHLLLSSQEPSIQRDYPYRVLSFLIASSRNVIRSFVDDDASRMALQWSKGKGAAQSSVDQIDVETLVEIFEEDSDDEWWKSHISYESGDTLSEWSEEMDEMESEQEGKDVRSSTTVDALDDNAMDSAGLADVVAPARRPLPARRPMFSNSTPGFSLTRQDQADLSSRQQRHQYDPPSLSMWLASQLSGGNPIQYLDPILCFQEHHLVHQVLQAFQGVSSPGPSFYFDYATQRYVAVKGVHTSQCSPFVLRPLLEMFAEIATRMRRIDTHCTTIIKACSGLGSADVAMYPTLVYSVAAALNQHIGRFRKLYLREDITSLLSLYMETCGNWKHYVQIIDERILPFLQVPVKPAENSASFSASLLNALSRTIQRFGMMSGATGGVIVSLLVDIFLNAIKPTMDALQAWLTSGSLANAPPEFFITKNQGMYEHLSNWEDGYMLKRDVTSGHQVVVPEIFKPLASTILSTGAVAAAIEAFGREDAGSKRPSLCLFTSFCDTLHMDVAQHAPTRGQHVTSKQGQEEASCPSSSLKKKGLTSEWTMASWRSAAYDQSIQSVCILETDDLKDLQMLPSSILELEAAQTICPPETALFYVDKCYRNGNGKENKSIINDHPIGDAMLASFWSKLDDRNEGDRNCPKHFEENPGAEVVKADGTEQHAGGGAYMAQQPAEWDGSTGWSEWYQRTQQALKPDNLSAVRENVLFVQTIACNDCFNSKDSLYATTVLPHRQSPVLWACFAPPADFMIKRAMQTILSTRIQDISHMACEKVLHAGLVSQLKTMRSVAMLSLPTIAQFVNVLVLQSSTPQGVDGVSLIDVNNALETAIGTSENDTFDDFSISGVDANMSVPHEHKPSSSIPSYVEGYSCLQINMNIKWPASMFMREDMVRVHQNLMIFNLQLEWCRQWLLAIHPWSRPTTGTLSKTKVALTLHDMLHFVMCLGNHVFWIVGAAGVALESQISESCSSIQSISAQCTAFAREIAEACRGVSDSSTLPLSSLLNAIIHVCSLLGKLGHYVQNEEIKDQEIDELEDEIRVTMNEYAFQKTKYLSALLHLRADSVTANESIKRFLSIFDPSGRYSIV